VLLEQALAAAEAMRLPAVVAPLGGALPEAARIAERAVLLHTAPPAEPPAPGEGLRRVGSLATALAAGPRVVWFPCPLQGLPEGPFAATAVLAADCAAQLAPHEEVEAFARELSARFARLVVASREALPPPPHARPIRLPLWRDPLRVAPPRDASVWVLADSIDCPLAGFALALAGRLAPGRPRRVVCAAPYGAPEAAPAALASLLAGGPAPALALDSAREAAILSPLREALLRAGVPVLRFGRDGPMLLRAGPRGPLRDAEAAALVLAGLAAPPPPPPVDGGGWAALERLLA
jgi:hypothetical protein